MPGEVRELQPLPPPPPPLYHRECAAWDRQDG